MQKNSKSVSIVTQCNQENESGGFFVAIITVFLTFVFVSMIHTNKDNNYISHSSTSQVTTSDLLTSVR